MQITKFVVDLIVFVIAALILADILLGAVTNESLFGLQQFQLIVGFVLNV